MDGWLIGSTIGLSGTTICGTCLLTLLARNWAPRLGFVDRPDGERKLHPSAIPLLGGVALFVGILISCLTVLALGDQKPGGHHWFDASARDSLFWLLATAGGFCLIGVCDDRLSLRPGTKFLWQIAACIPFAIRSPDIQSVSLGHLEVELEIWSIAFTIFWLVAIVNAVNLLDGMDGQATSVGIIACLAFASLAALQGDFLTTVLALLIAGNLTGFLWHNTPPARIFLGDAGSLTLGFLLGALALRTNLAPDGRFPLLIPCVILAVPLFDTSMAVIRRKLKGRGIGQADREHIHHCLQDRGFNRWQALGIVSLCAVVQAIFAVSAVAADEEALGFVGLILTLGSLVALKLFGDKEIGLIYQWLRQSWNRETTPRHRPFNPLEWMAF